MIILKKLFGKDSLKKALPILAATVVALIQAIADQKDSEKIEELETRMKNLESKSGA